MSRFFALLVAIAVLSRPAASQALSPCRESIPSMGDGPSYYDALERLYNRLDSTFTHDGKGRLNGEQSDRFDVVRLRTSGILDRLTSGRVERQLPRDLYENLGAYWDFVTAVYPKDSVPPVLEARVCPIRAAYLVLVKDSLIEHGRKLTVRYGDGSERLNIVEMLLNEWTTSHAPVGELRDPSPWEWILRMQTLGYQYRRATRELEPSFPVFQLGFTRYLYDNGSLAGVLHHVGVSAAYQRDVTNSRNLWGAMLHVQEFDVGLLCASRCSDHVVVASKNLSLVGNAWTRLRKSLGR